MNVSFAVDRKMFNWIIAVDFGSVRFISRNAIVFFASVLRSFDMYVVVRVNWALFIHSLHVGARSINYVISQIIYKQNRYLYDYEAWQDFMSKRDERRKKSPDSSEPDREKNEKTRTFGMKKTRQFLGIGNHNRIICGREITTTFIYFSSGNWLSEASLHPHSELFNCLFIMVNFSFSSSVPSCKDECWSLDMMET